MKLYPVSSRTIHKGLLIFVLLFLVAFFCGARLLDIQERSLAGGWEPTPDSLSWDSWNSGDFQKSTGKYLDYHTGFRNSIVRLHNQINYSLFRISPTRSVVMGVDGYLFESNYIDTYLGKDYQGIKNISEQVNRLIQIHRYLASYGIDLLIVFAPNKARIYPEYLHPSDPEISQVPSNYQEYVRQFNKHSFLHFIDFNKSFLEMKDTSGNRLLPKYGIHWTNFICQTYVTDSLHRYIEYLRGIRIPEFRPSDIFYSDTLQTPDNDLYELLNLVTDQSGELLPYPVFGDESSHPDIPVRVLTIGDSFFWNIYANPPWRSLFIEDDFWHYGGERYPTSKYKNFNDTTFRHIRWDIMSHDVVMVLLTEINLMTFLNFPEQGIAWLGLEGGEDLYALEKFENRVNFFINMIRNDEIWLRQIRIKAADRNITLEEMIRLDANFMAEQKEIHGW